MQVFGQAEQMDIAPMDIDVGDGGRVMIPVRFVSQALGCTDAWDGPTKTVTITPAVTPATYSALKAELAAMTVKWGAAESDRVAAQVGREQAESNLAVAEAKLARIKADFQS